MMADNTGVVMLAVGATVVMTEASQAIDNKGLTFKPILAGGLLGIFLFLLSAINTTLGTGFAVLIIISTMLINGPKVFGAATTHLK